MREKGEKNAKLLQWHQAFYAGIQIELQSYAGALTFENEHMLSTKPMQIDVLVIKKEPQTNIQKNIGRIFRTYNIIEYKSPDDHLNTDDFYKVYGYGCFYKSDTVVVDQIPIRELTLTFVCYHYPRKVIRHLEEMRGCLTEKQEAGIYYVTGDLIPIQIIVVPELTDEKNLWLHSLTNRIRTSKTAAQLIHEYEEHRQNRLYESVMEIVVRSNRSKFQEADSMCQALYDLFKDQLEQKAREMAEEKVVQIVAEKVEQMAEEKAVQMAEEKAVQMAEEKAVQMAEELAEQKVAKMSADIFSDGEIATQVSLIAKKIKRGKPLSVIAAELEETEEVILPLYKRVSAQLALQA